MKTLLSKMTVVIALSLVVLSAAIPANAQTSPMRVQIPFAFLAGEKIYPAGEYLIKVDGNFRLADLRPVKESAVDRILLTGGLLKGRGTEDNEGYLLFNRYGATYALSGIWSAGAPRGFKAAPSKAEQEMARANGGAPTAETEIHSVR